MKNYLLTFSLMLLTIITFGQGVVTGKVVSNEQQGIEYANILLLNAKDSSLAKGSVTDAMGAYSIENISNGEYLVSATMMGFENAYSIPFVISATRQEVNIPSLVLIEGGVDLGEVNITAAKPFIQIQADKLVVNVAESPVMAGNTALEVLRKSPGVVIDNDNNITMKGRQGVLVMIDDKPTYMSAEELTRMLENMPASSIQSIEIINNPSAKYDAAGNAGIINIKLKKDANLGLNGSVNIGGGLGLYQAPYGPFHKLNSSVRLNYRQKKLNVFGGYNYWASKGFNTNTIRRNIIFNENETIFNQSSKRDNWGESHNYDVGADYFVSDKTTVGLLAKGRFGTWNNMNDTSLSMTKVTGYNDLGFSNLVAGNEGQNHWKSISLNGNVRHEFGKKGSVLTLDTDYSVFNNWSENDYSNTFYNEGMQIVDENILMSNNRSDVTIKAVKLDYKHPIDDKTSLEMGAKSSFVTTDNDVLFYMDEGGSWIVDSSQSNNFVYQEDIHAAYLNFNKQFKHFGVQAGLRAEYTSSLGESVTLDTSVARGYLNFFPSVSISHQMGEDHSFSLSYSRRIDRPTYQDLNPFVFFLDQYTFNRGNPLLRPQLTNAISTTYGFKSAAFLTVSYSRTLDAMTEIIRQDDSLKLTFQTEENLAQVDNFSINLSSPIPIKKWWMARVNVSAFYNDFYSPYSDNSIIDRQSWAYNVYVGNNFTINKQIRAELSANYQSAMNYGIIDMQAQWGVDAGLSARIMNGKGSLSINVNDLFNTRYFRGTIVQGSVNADVQSNWESRKVFVSFSYNFGNDKVKPNRRRRTATEDEQNRIKN